jgi:hypothetical protein
MVRTVAARANKDFDRDIHFSLEKRWCSWANGYASLPWVEADRCRKIFSCPELGWLFSLTLASSGCHPIYKRI